MDMDSNVSVSGNLNSSGKGADLDKERREKMRLDMEIEEIYIRLRKMPIDSEKQLLKSKLIDLLRERKKLCELNGLPLGTYHPVKWYIFPKETDENKAKTGVDGGEEDAQDCQKSDCLIGFGQQMGTQGEQICWDEDRDYDVDEEDIDIESELDQIESFGIQE
jgi:hypothetical protein